MAFIPAINKQTTRVLAQDAVATKGTITKGSVVRILNCTDRGYDIEDLDSGEIMIECSFDIFEVE